MRFLFTICFVLSLCSFTIPASNSFMELGMGIDIIQGKQQLLITLVNAESGEAQVFFFNSKGAKLGFSPTLSKAAPRSSVSTIGWNPGVYNIEVVSKNGICSHVKSFIIN